MIILASWIFRYLEGWEGGCIVDMHIISHVCLKIVWWYLAEILIKFKRCAACKNDNSSFLNFKVSDFVTSLIEISRQKLVCHLSNVFDIIWQECRSLFMLYVYLFQGNDPLNLVNISVFLCPHFKPLLLQNNNIFTVSGKYVWEV